MTGAEGASTAPLQRRRHARENETRHLLIPRHLGNRPGFGIATCPVEDVTPGKAEIHSVATLHGIALADGLSPVDLKNRFPELHEIVTGIAWAGALEAR